MARDRKVYTKDQVVTKITNQIKEYIDSFTNTIQNCSGHELKKFWLRKSKKIVLSVLAVQSPLSEELIFFKGMNLEVSLPTGSLCAERNAIGSAVAEFPNIKRANFIAVATVILNLNSITKNDFITDISTSVSSQEQFDSSSDSDGAASTTSCKDRNPIWPCGVCSEWLKKITAEHEDDFYVVAFSDSFCNNPIVQILNPLVD